jgi:hypothetical protein
LRQTHQPLPAYPANNNKNAEYGYADFSGKVFNNQPKVTTNAAKPIECPFYDFATDSILMFKTLLRDEF